MGRKEPTEAEKVAFARFPDDLDQLAIKIEELQVPSSALSPPTPFPPASTLLRCSNLCRACECAALPCPWQLQASQIGALSTDAVRFAALEKELAVLERKLSDLTSNEGSLQGELDQKKVGWDGFVTAPWCSSGGGMAWWCMGGGHAW